MTNITRCLRYLQRHPDITTVTPALLARTAWFAENSSEYSPRDAVNSRSECEKINEIFTAYQQVYGCRYLDNDLFAILRCLSLSYPNAKLGGLPKQRDQIQECVVLARQLYMILWPALHCDQIPDLTYKFYNEYAAYKFFNCDYRDSTVVFHETYVLHCLSFVKR